MAAYSDDPTTTCAQTFTQEALLQSFPDSTALRALPSRPYLRSRPPRQKTS